LPLPHLTALYTDTYDRIIFRLGDTVLRSIAVCNLKGGVGKTTTTVNVGASLARAGKSVLLIDCDPQASLTGWLRATPHNDEPTLYDILRGQATVRTAAMPTRWDNLSVVPASPRLNEIDRGALAGERVLWARMNDDYDYALFDCSASPGVVLTNALTASDGVVVPVQAKGMALGGVERLQRLLAEVASRSGNLINLAGILVCLFDGRTKISRMVLGELRAKYSGLVFDAVIHEDVKLSESADRRLPTAEYAPDSRATAEYAAVAFELMTRSLAPVATRAGAEARPSGAAQRRPEHAAVHSPAVNGATHTPAAALAATEASRIAPESARSAPEPVEADTSRPARERSAPRPAAPRVTPQSLVFGHD
jgi:chromosome partitioning protein